MEFGSLSVFIYKGFIRPNGGSLGFQPSTVWYGSKGFVGGSSLLMKRMVMVMIDVNLICDV